MLTSYFIAFIVCVAASDRNSLIFHPNETILTNCVEHQISVVDSQFQLTLVVNDAAHLASRRYHGKTMTRKYFNNRFTDFFNDLRKKKVTHEIDEVELTEQLKTALKKALIVCADMNLLSTITLKKEKFESNDAKVTVQDNEWISFSPNKYLLSKCIESHLKLTGHREFHLEHGFTEHIANLAANRNGGKSSSRKIFNVRNRNFFYDLQKKKIFHEKHIGKLLDELKELINRAVEDCAVGRLSLVPVPTFEIEPPKLAQLLNIILVTWPDDLRHMIQSKNGRVVLRRYARDALTALIRELNVFQNNVQIIRFALRSFWKSRAQEMYDANYVDFPYIKHRYNLNYPTPHMIQSDFEKFINRTDKSFSNRDPFVPKTNSNEILNIHRSDYHKSGSDDDIFDNYNNNGMTSAEYYLENKIIQFYRIIFFFLELCARAICTDKDDIFIGPLPNFLVPQQIQAIIHDDDAYRNYLLDERHFYKMLMDNSTQNEIIRNLIETTWIHEENLVLLKSNWLSITGINLNNEPQNLLESSNVITATTQSLKRKDDVGKDENGKCFPKRAKVSTYYNDDSINDNMDTYNFNSVTESPSQEILSFFITNSTDKNFSSYSDFSASQQLKRNETNNNFGYLEYLYRDYDFMESKR